MQRHIAARVLLCIALVLISWLSLTPSPPEQITLSWDKLNHFVAFFSLAFLSDFSFPQANGQRTQVNRYRNQCLMLILYGASIEISQWWFGFRVFELLDIVADCLGIFAYLLVVWLISSLSQRNQNKG